MATLHALIIGINGYKQCRPLNGCIHDATEVGKFFQELCKAQENLQPNFKYLLEPGSDQEKSQLLADGYQFDSPTRNNVIAAFSHFAEAKDGDFCLLYYSGHGSTVNAPEVFKGYEPGDVLQTIVCADSRSGDVPDLIDKELGYLIAKAVEGKEPDPKNPEKGVHFLAIFDSCHSGTVTRGDDDNVQVARMAVSGPVPKVIEGFTTTGNCFYEAFKAGQTSVKPGGLRHARYINLSAARNTESAIETNFTMPDGKVERRGVFTWSLLNALRQNGAQISYGELMRRVEVSVRTRVDNQIPVLGKTDYSDDNLMFLRNQVKSIPLETFYGAYDHKTGKWILKAGEINGVPNPQKVENAYVKLGETCIPVLSTEPTEAELDGEALKELDKEQPHAFTLDPSFLYKVVIGIHSSLSETQRQEFLNAYNANRPVYSKIAEAGDTVQYEVKMLPYKDTNEPCYVLTRPGSVIPLFMRTPKAPQFVTDMGKICRYEHVLQLSNPDSAIPDDALSVQVSVMEGVAYDQNSFVEISKKNELFVPAPNQSTNRPFPEIVKVNGKLQGEQMVNPAIKVRLEVKPGYKYWIGGLYCDEKYAVSGAFLPMTEVGAGADLPFLEANLNAGQYQALPLIIDEQWANLGVTEIVDYLILFISTKKVDFSQYEQEGVELDTMRSVGFPNNKAFAKQDWKTIKIPIRISIPKAKQKLAAGLRKDFGAFAIQAPDGFNADCEAVTRSNALAGKSADEWSAALPPHNLWDGVEGRPEVFARGISNLPDAHLNAIEFQAVDGSIDMDHPILITPADPLNDDEAILPFGWDDNLKLWMPMGYTDSEGKVRVVKLPSMTDELIGMTEEGQKSLGSSFKLFFQKLVWSKITGRKHYNSLTLMGFDGSGAPIRSTVYHGTPGASDQQALTAIRAAVQGGPVLLIVHGIIGDTDLSAPALMQRPAIKGKFKTILAFDYENLDTEIEKIGETLYKILSDLQLPAKSVTIVSHSMGGMVSRWMLEKIPGATAIVDKLIQIGVPNTGSEVSDFRKKLTGWIGLGLNGVAALKPYLSFCSMLWKGLEKRLFRTLNQLDPGSEFMEKINGAQAERNGVRYYLVIGNTELIESSADENQAVLRQLLVGLKERAKYILADYAFFGGDHPNDLVVRVDRAEDVKGGFTEKKVDLACDHISYFKNTAAMEKIEEFILN